MRVGKRAFLCAIFIGFSLLLSDCGAPSAPRPENSSTSAPAAGEPTQAVASLPTASSAPEPATTLVPLQPALPERRRLTLEFPPEIRVGDADVVRLTLEVDELGNLTPTAEIGGHVVTGQTVEIPNL